MLINKLNIPVDRWLAWVITAMIVAAAVTWYYAEITITEMDSFAIEAHNMVIPKKQIKVGKVTDFSNWKTYRNEKYGFGFAYPSEFSVTKDGVMRTYPNGKDWYRLEVSNLSVSEIPKLKFEINADGYGPFFPDKLYEVVLDEEKIIKVLSEVRNYDENSHDGYLLVIPNSIENKSGDSLSWYLSFKEGGDDFESILKQILSTFKFVEPQSKIDISGWKTYVNKKLNYTIKYPAELTVGNGIDPESAFDYVDTLNLDDKDGRFIDIFHEENSGQLSVGDWLKSERGRIFYYNNSNHKLLNISPLTWYIFDPPLTYSLDQSAFRWGLFNNSDFFLVGNKTKLSDSTIERILSTFKFVVVVPPGYDAMRIKINYRAGTDVSDLSTILPVNLRNEVAKIDRLVPSAGPQFRWIQIDLKPGVDGGEFMYKIRSLNWVEIAEFVPLPVPPQFP